jgi:6-phosphogluconate dehydrogenase
MQLGFVGLGKMGANMVERLLKGGHQLVVTNRGEDPIKEAVKKGAVGAANLADVVSKLSGKKAVWLMIPSGDPVEQAIHDLVPLLNAGDIVIDGGNSNYKDSVRRGEFLKSKGIEFMDSGTSGGVWGLKNGYCLMVGASKETFEYLEPALKTLAPEKGYLHAGPIGSGHYTKMIHNGIEYAMMQAYGEGFELLKEGPYKLDLGAIANLWMQGSVVRSWLLELAASALTKDPELTQVKAYVSDSGEGRWTVHEAIDRAVPAYTIAASLFARFASRKPDDFSLKLLSALRNEFGGHEIKKA